MNNFNRRKEHDELVEKILIALGNKPELGKFWAQRTGATESIDGYWIRYGLKGSADISGILRGGTRAEIEVKTGGAVQQKNQKNFQAMIKEYKGFYCVARDITGVLSDIENFLESRIKEAPCKQSLNT